MVDAVVMDDGVVMFIRFVARDNMSERIPQLSGIPRKKCVLLLPMRPNQGIFSISQGASNIRLEQVRPDSAFCNSEMSSDST
jgi:hypothetical protein